MKALQQCLNKIVRLVIHGQVASRQAAVSAPALECKGDMHKIKKLPELPGGTGIVRKMIVFQCPAAPEYDKQHTHLFLCRKRPAIASASSHAVSLITLTISAFNKYA